MKEANLRKLHTYDSNYMTFWNKKTKQTMETVKRSMVARG